MKLVGLANNLLRAHPETKPPVWTGREILWEAFPRGLPAGAPTIRCIAANGFVLRSGGKRPRQHLSGQAVDPKNERSLAFLVQFNNFKYYIGGDVETKQEDGIMDYLSPKDEPARKIHAMKCSHHGSERSTSNDFIDRLKPSAAFISCGENNSYGHPSHRIIKHMHASVEAPESVYLSSYGTSLPDEEMPDEPPGSLSRLLLYQG